LDAGLSVFRVGGAAQTPIMKRVAGRLRIDIAQFEEMAQFVKFGAEVDATTALQLARGERARGLLSQGQHEPMPLSEQVIVLQAAVTGVFDDVPVSGLESAEDELLGWARVHVPELLGEIELTSMLTPDLEAALNAALGQFSAQRHEAPSQKVASQPPVEPSTSVKQTAAPVGEGR
jgi:F-type H+-transporting ATPase subunit alpha